MTEDNDVDHDVINAPWYEKATREEKQRLSVLMRRKGMKTDAISEIAAEIKVIRRRAIARKRRAEGKT